MPRGGHDESREVVWLKDTFNFWREASDSCRVSLTYNFFCALSSPCCCQTHKQTSSLAELPDVEKDGLHSICQPLTLVSFFPSSMLKTPSSGIRGWCRSERFTFYFSPSLRFLWTQIVTVTSTSCHHMNLTVTVKIIQSCHRKADSYTAAPGFRGLDRDRTGKLFCEF